MQNFLQQVLPLAAELYGMNRTAPEIYSGRPDSPIWFVGENPRGTGSPPTILDALEAPDSYAAYYRDKYRSGRPLSKTGALYDRLWREFAAAAGLPQPQSWQWMMKTNKYAMPTNDHETRRRLPNAFPLDAWFRELVQAYKPVEVIAFYHAGAELIRNSRVGPLLDGKLEPIPARDTGVTYLIDCGHIAGGRGGDQFPAGYMAQLGRQLRERLSNRCNLTHEAADIAGTTHTMAPSTAQPQAPRIPDSWLAAAPWLPLALVVGGTRVAPRESKSGNRLTLQTCQPRWLSVVRDEQAARLTVGFHDGIALLARHAVHGKLWRQNENSDVDGTVSQQTRRFFKAAIRQKAVRSVAPWGGAADPEEIVSGAELVVVVPRCVTAERMRRAVSHCETHGIPVRTAQGTGASAICTAVLEFFSHS